MTGLREWKDNLLRTMHAARNLSLGATLSVSGHPLGVAAMNEMLPLLHTLIEACDKPENLFDHAEAIHYVRIFQQQIELQYPELAKAYGLAGAAEKTIELLREHPDYEKTQLSAARVGRIEHEAGNLLAWCREQGLLPAFHDRRLAPTVEPVFSPLPSPVQSAKEEAVVQESGGGRGWFRFRIPFPKIFRQGAVSEDVTPAGSFPPLPQPVMTSVTNERPEPRKPLVEEPGVFTFAFGFVCTIGGFFLLGAIGQGQVPHPVPWESMDMHARLAYSNQIGEIVRLAAPGGLAIGILSSEAVALLIRDDYRLLKLTSDVLTFVGENAASFAERVQQGLAMRMHPELKEQAILAI